MPVPTGMLNVDICLFQVEIIIRAGFAVLVAVIQDAVGMGIYSIRP